MESIKSKRLRKRKLRRRFQLFRKKTEGRGGVEGEPSGFPLRIERSGYPARRRSNVG